MKKVKGIFKYFTALILVIVLAVGSSSVAYAADPVTITGTIISGLSLAVQMYANAQSDQERQEALDNMMMCWDDTPTSSHNEYYRIELSFEELNSLCSELNQSGFPCKVVLNQWVGGYVIEGCGYVYVPGILESREIHLGDMIFCNYQKFIYYAEHDSNETLENIYNALTGTEHDGTLRDVFYVLDMIYYRLTLFYDYISGGADGTSLYDKIDDLIAAVEGISITTGDVTFDTTPITDKLDSVISAISKTNGYVDGLEGYVDGVESTLTTISTRTNTLITTLTTTNTYVDGLESALSGIKGHVDGLEGYVDGLESTTTSIKGYVDGVESTLTTISTNLITNNTYVDTVEDKLIDVVTAVEGIDFDTTPVEDKLTEVVTAVEGITFDTTPVTDKLTEVDGKLLTLLTDFGTHVNTITGNMDTNTEDIVAAIGEPLDLTPLTEQLQAVTDEIQKISTFADLHEVITVTPGVLGDVEVVTSGDWRYDNLSFYYEPQNAEFEAYTEVEYIANDFIDYDTGTGTYFYDLTDRNYNGYPAVSIIGLVGFRPSGAAPVMVNVYDGGGNLLHALDMSTLSGEPLSISLDEASYMEITVEYGGNYWLEGTGPGCNFIGVSYGYFNYPAADSLSFTVDGVPHSLYWSNEYEFPDGCNNGDIIYYSDGHWYKENLYGSGTVWTLNYYDAYLTDALTPPPTTTSTMEGETYTWFEWFYTSYKGGTGGVADLTPVVKRLDTIIENLNATVGDSSCNHSYQSEINQEPTCILPGLQTFSCSQCDSCYSEILSSLGHDWKCTDHVEDELDPETGEVVKTGYDIYTCSRCEETYNDYESSGAPAKESDSITAIIARLFEKIGKLIGDLISGAITLLDKLLTGFDDIVTSFNEKTEQIVSFGGDYPQWLSGVWGIIPADLQLALSFCVVVMCLAIIGKKVLFVS